MLQLTKKKGHANLWSQLISYQLQIVINSAFTRQWHVHPGATLGWTTPSLPTPGRIDFKFIAHARIAAEPQSQSSNESSRVIAWCFMGRRCGKNHENITRIHQKVRQKNWLTPQFWAGHSNMVTPQPKCFTPMPKIVSVSFVGCLVGRAYVLLNHWITLKRTMQSNFWGPVKDKTLGAGSWNCLAR